MIVRARTQASGWSRYPALAAVLGLALAVRLVVNMLAPAGAVLGSVDAQGYWNLAVNLRERLAFSLAGSPPYLADGVRMPLYPAWLALLAAWPGDPTRTIAFAQALLDTATAAVVYLLAWRVTGSGRGALLAAFLYAINPFSPLYAGQALSETLVAGLLACTILAFAWARVATGLRRSAAAGIVGLLAGLCILCKPNLVLLPLILAVGLGWPPARRWRQAVLVLAVAGLLLLPWVTRNRLAFGRWFLSLAFEDNLTHISAVATIFEAEGAGVRPWTTAWEDAYMNRIVAVAGARYRWAERGDARVSAIAAARQQAEVAAVAGEILAAHPTAFVIAHLKGVSYSLVPSLHVPWYELLTGRPWPADGPLTIGAALALAGSYLIYGLAYLGLLIGLWRLRDRPGLLWASGLTLVYLVLLPGPIAGLRFWVPGVPLAAIVLAQALSMRSDQGPWYI
jgi:hypothetical protein